MELDDEHTKCSICTTNFSSDRDNKDPEIRKHLPVLSSSQRCDHWFCHGCILREQLRVAEANNGRVPKWIKCMHCREKTSFNPAEPKYHRLLIDLLARAQKHAAAHAKNEGKREQMSVGEASAQIVAQRRNHQKQTSRKRRKTTTKKDVTYHNLVRLYGLPDVNRKTTTNQDVNRAAAFIKDTIRHYELSDVINLLGECIFFESLFIWRKLSMELYKNQRCIDSLGLVGEIQFVIKNNCKSLFSLLIELSEIKLSDHYQAVEGSKDVVNLTFQRAMQLATDFLFTKQLPNSNDIAKQIKAHHIPIESIMIPIEETLRNCLDEGQLSREVAEK